MRLVVQRVARAAVRVAGAGGELETVGTIGRGLLVLAGVGEGDGEAQVHAAADKLRFLRIFEDAEGKMNLDLAQAGGAILLVSQFTLLADTERGRRPSFVHAARPQVAEPLLERLAARLRETGLEVATGRFGASMQVDLVNDGPVTLVLDFPPTSEAKKEKTI